MSNKQDSGTPTLQFLGASGIYGEDVEVNATIETLHGLSAHADQGELLRWLKGFDAAPKQTFIVHGEPDASATLAKILSNDWSWNASVAEDGATVNLTEVASNQPAA